MIKKSTLKLSNLKLPLPDYLAVNSSNAYEYLYKYGISTKKIKKC